MESFFLSETLKYLYLLFDEGNFIHSGNYVFTTEGHPFKVTALTRKAVDFGGRPEQERPARSKEAAGDMTSKADEATAQPGDVDAETEAISNPDSLDTSDSNNASREDSNSSDTESSSTPAPVAETMPLDSVRASCPRKTGQVLKSNMNMI